MKNHIRRYLEWEKKHHDVIVISTLIGSGLVLFGLIVKSDLDRQRLALTRLSTSINELNAWHDFEYGVDKLAA